MSTFEANLHLIPNATPKFLKARSVLFALVEAIQAELERLEEAGVLQKVNQGKWAAPIVPVPKTDGQLRTCGDYKMTVNPALQVEKYPLLKPDHLFATLAGGKKLSKIDLTSAYQQMSLDEKSRELVTINTHKDLRMPVHKVTFWGSISSSHIPEEVLQGLPQVICYLDDILITGSSDEEHLANMERVLEEAEEVRHQSETIQVCLPENLSRVPGSPDRCHKPMHYPKQS